MCRHSDRDWQNRKGVVVPSRGAKEWIIDFGNEEASTLRCSSGKVKIPVREQCTSN